MLVDEDQVVGAAGLLPTTTSFIAVQVDEPTPFTLLSRKKYLLPDSNPLMIASQLYVPSMVTFLTSLGLELK